MTTAGADCILLERGLAQGGGASQTTPRSQGRPGDLIRIDAQNFNDNNNVLALVIDSDTDWFEIANPDGVVEDNKTLGTGTLRRFYVTTKDCGIGDQIKWASGELVLHVLELV